MMKYFWQAIKRYQGQMREAECGYEEEQRQRQEVAHIISAYSISLSKNSSNVTCDLIKS